MTTIINRYRGDTVPDEITVKQPDGSPQDLTSYSFLLTVNSVKNPPDDTTQLFQVVGTIIDAPNGVVEFAPNSTQANQTPGKYYFDIQAITPTGRKHTISAGIYRFKQDVTKT